MQYAHIKNNNRVNIIEVEPEKVSELQANGVNIIDISSLPIKPKKNWVYDSQSQTFFAPPEIILQKSKPCIHLTADKDELIADNKDIINISLTIRKTKNIESDIINYNKTERIEIKGYGAIKANFVNGIYTKQLKTNQSGVFKFKIKDDEKYNAVNVLKIWALVE